MQMQQIFAISGLINFIVSIIISIFVFIKRRNYVNFIFCLLTLTASFWSLGYWFWLNEYISAENAIFWLKFLTFFSIWIPIFFMHWISLLLKNLIVKKINTLVIITSYIFGGLFTLSNFTSLLIKGVGFKLYFIFWPNAGPLYLFYIIFIYLGLSVYTAIILITSFYRSTGSIKNQIKYVATGTLIALIGGFFNFFLWYDIPIPPYGNFVVPIYFVLLTYAMIKYRLMDIRLVISKSVLYFFLVLFVALSFTFVTFSTAQFFQGQGQVATTLLVSLIIVIGLDPLKKLLAKWTDKFFYKGKIDYQDVLRLVSQSIAKELDLEILLKIISNELEPKLKLKKINILINKSNKFEKYETLDFNNTLILDRDDEIIKYFYQNKKIIITEELSRRRSELKDPAKILLLENLEKRLDELGIALAIPILVEQELTGLFLIEGKMSGGAFTQEDLNFFEVLAPQVATALEKAKLFKEVQLAKKNLEVLVEQRTHDLQERNRYLSALQVLINLITRSLDFQKVMQTIADGISVELGFIGGLLNFIDFNKNCISVGAISNTKATQKVIAMIPQDPRQYAVSLEERENLAVKAINERKIISGSSFYDFISPALPKELADKIQTALGAKLILAVPIYSEEKIIGVIDFVLAKSAEQVTSVEKEMMKSLSDQVGIVYRNISLYKEIQRANLDLKSANERLTKLDQAKSEFLSIASHQLRTPLTGIKGYLSMILEGDFGVAPPKIKKVVEEVFQNTDRLTRLVNIFLNVSRIESGRFELEIRDVDLIKLIEEVLSSLKIAAEQKELDLIFHKPASLLPLFKLDHDKIKDVLLNLIDNAIKYTNKGKVEIFVETIGAALQVKIKDTGIGIAKGEDRELFKKFVRGEGIAQINTGGSGLGLYIVKKIVEAHGGKVWVESAGAGMGSTFIFTFPI